MTEKRETYGKVKYECCFYDTEKGYWSTDCAFDSELAAIKYVVEIAYPLEHITAVRVIKSDTRQVTFEGVMRMHRGGTYAPSGVVYESCAHCQDRLADDEIYTVGEFNYCSACNYDMWDIIHEVTTIMNRDVDPGLTEEAVEAESTAAWLDMTAEDVVKQLREAY
jgi:hypothetical protein